MTCDKRAFDTEDDAKEAMNRVSERPTGQVPIRVYRCPICPGGKWHYTSKQEMKRRV
jgi:hypothetical protein